jgi:indolepyruvate ferredoxin oxidoreductase
VLLLGFAWQRGLVPVSLQALTRAIELNAVAVNNNKLAFAWGRMAAIEPERISQALSSDSDDATLDAVVARRRDFLVAYQHEQLAARFDARVASVLKHEMSLGGDGRLADAVARTYFKLLSYKDEYEVARLHTRKEFIASVRSAFGEKAKFRFHLAPPILNAGKDARGRPRKKEFGAWILPVFRVLARLKGLRGTAFDVFGYTAERRMERALIGEFEHTLEELLAVLNMSNLQAAIDIVALYMKIRGYGPVKETSVETVRREVADALQNPKLTSAAVAA